MTLPFGDFEVDPPANKKRESCMKCRRPKQACLCSFLPEAPIELQTSVHILQHPRETSRLLTTVPILEVCLPANKFNIYVGRRFALPSYPELHQVISAHDHVAVLYPAENATELSQYAKEHKEELKRAPLQLIVVDGTWREAKALYKQNEFLHVLPVVKVTRTERSQFVIRTQPTMKSFSTLEAVAFALATVEENGEIAEVLIKPLQALCRIQLEHGAVVHSSKEEKLLELQSRS